MAAPYSNSKKKGSSHAELSLRGLRSRVQRANLRPTALYTEWLAQSQRPETLAEVSSPWSVLRSVPAQTCAHVYGRRTHCFRARSFIAAIVLSFSARTRESTFNEMAWESAAAQVPATQGCDPRPIRLTQLLGLFFVGHSPRCSAACSRRGVNPPLLSPRGFCAGRALLLFRCASTM